MAKKSVLKAKIRRLESEVLNWRQGYEVYRRNQPPSENLTPAVVAMARDLGLAKQELSQLKAEVGSMLNAIDVYLQSLAKDNSLIFKDDGVPRLKGIVAVEEAITLAKRTRHGLEVLGKQRDCTIRSLDARNLKLRKSLADLSQRYQKLKSRVSSKTKNPWIRSKFAECPTCAAIPGMPTLCRECTERRELFDEREKGLDSSDSVIPQIFPANKGPAKGVTATPRDGRKTRFA